MSLTLDGSNSVTINSGAVLGITSGTAVASTSGTSITFTGIPSWAKRITVMFQGVSTSGTSNPLIQIGAGSVTTSGYLGGGAGATAGSVVSISTYTTGFGVSSGSAANVLHGSFIINLITGNSYVLNGSLTASNQTAWWTTTGSVTLSGVLDRVVITTVGGTDTFDAGTINILYE